jgi:predicted ester cyclase
MATAAHKAIVRRYVEEALDHMHVALLDDIVPTDCIIHRPGLPEPLRGLVAFKQFFASIPQVYSEVTTTIHDLLAEEDRVACRLRHRAVHRGAWSSRLGRHAVGGKTVRWSAIAIFRLRKGKIAEAWVNRDVLGMLRDLGIVAPTATSS